MPSLYTAVSGLRTNQTKLDVISNNVANSNSIGYKSQNVSFSDVLNQTIKGASAPNANTGSGGTNAMQVGLGVSLASITTDTTTGSLQQTGNATDMAIDGEGYFVVKNGDGTYSYTRAGNFGIDSGGNLVTADGLCVCGWVEYSESSDGTVTFDTTTEPVGINLYSDNFIANKQSLNPEATTAVTLTGNLDSSESAVGTAADAIGTAPASPQATTTMTVYDSLGNPHEADIDFSKCFVDDTTDPDNPVTTWYYEISAEDGSVPSPASGYLKFDAEGNVVDETGYEAAVSVTMDMTDSGTTDPVFTIDFSAISMYNSDSTAYVLSSDGREASELVDYTIGQDGVIQGVYDSGETRPLGCIALATFANPAGLLKTGNSLYTTTANSGKQGNLYQPGTGNAGSISTGYLEMSNVNLASEFTEMIVAQRAYQANSKVITTADEMLQILINLKS